MPGEGLGIFCTTATVGKTIALVVDSKTKTPSALELLAPIIDLAPVSDTAVEGCVAKEEEISAFWPLKSNHDVPLENLSRAAEGVLASSRIVPSVIGSGGGSVLT